MSVPCICVNPEINKFWIMNCGIFNIAKDGYSKFQHVSKIFRNLHHSEKLKFWCVLMDTQCVTGNIIVQINGIGKIFYHPLKNNKLIANSVESEFCKISGL